LSYSRGPIHQRKSKCINIVHTLGILMFTLGMAHSHQFICLERHLRSANIIRR